MTGAPKPRPIGQAILDELRDLDESARLERAADLVPYASFIGIAFQRDAGGIVGLLRYAERNIGNMILPAIHGGVVGGFLEHTAVMQLVVETLPTAMPRPVSTTVAYLRPSGPRDVFARARIVKRGRNISNLRVEAWQESEDKPVASAEVILMAGGS